MPYNAAALARRRCTARRKDGEPCRAFALWDDPRQLCSAHAGRTRGESRRGQRLPSYECRTVPKCYCPAYRWPHRPGGGLCRWPHLPAAECSTPPGTPSASPRPRGLPRTIVPTKRRTVRAAPFTYPLE